MSTGIVVLVAFLVVVALLGFPTRRRAESLFTPAQEPHPLLRPFLAVAKWRRRRRARRRRLRSL